MRIRVVSSNKFSYLRLTKLVNCFGLSKIRRFFEIFTLNLEPDLLQIDHDITTSRMELSFRSL